jgi:hypothetical protein
MMEDKSSTASEGAEEAPTVANSESSTPRSPKVPLPGWASALLGLAALLLLPFAIIAFASLNAYVTEAVPAAKAIDKVHPAPGWVEVSSEYPDGSNCLFLNDCRWAARTFSAEQVTPDDIRKVSGYAGIEKLLIDGDCKTITDIPYSRAGKGACTAKGAIGNHDVNVTVDKSGDGSGMIIRFAVHEAGD